jgi:hypothetical protein
MIGGGEVDRSFKNSVSLLDLSDLQSIKINIFSPGLLPVPPQSLSEPLPSSLPLYAQMAYPAYPSVITIGGATDWEGLTRLSDKVKKYSFTWSAPSLKELCVWAIKRNPEVPILELPEELQETITDYWYTGDHQPNKIIVPQNLI